MLGIIGYALAKATWESRRIRWDWVWGGTSGSHPVHLYVFLCPLSSSRTYDRSRRKRQDILIRLPDSGWSLEISWNSMNFRWQGLVPLEKLTVLEGVVSRIRPSSVGLYSDPFPKANPPQIRSGNFTHWCHIMFPWDMFIERGEGTQWKAAIFGCKSTFIFTSGYILIPSKYDLIL